MEKRRAVEFDARNIDAVFNELDGCHLPGAAVGVAIDGRPVYRKGFGLANMELPTVLSPAIRMRLGSVTKQFTCLACLLLCEDGRADVDDPLGRYLPGLHERARAVTLRQLMAHTSGLYDACDIRLQFGANGGPVVTSQELTEFYRDTQGAAAPDTTWVYNNGGYVLLSAVIERLSGATLEDVLRARVFEPVGMNDTLVRRFDSDFVPNSAAPHMGDSASGYRKPDYGLDWSGAGAMVSTVDDMLRWLEHMDDPNVGTAATWALMKTPQTLSHGISTGYGLGLSIGRYRGLETLQHTGGWMGANAIMLKLPAARLDLIVMVNRHDLVGITLAHKILDACLPQLDPVPEPAPHFVSGVFRSRLTGRVIRLFGREGQQFASIDGMEMPVARGADDVLRPVGVHGFLKLEIALQGDPASPAFVKLSDFGNADQLIAVPSRTSAAADLAGTYCCRAAGIDTTIQLVGDELLLTAMSRFGTAHYRLEPLAVGVWRARPEVGAMRADATVSFEDDFSGFRFSTHTTRSLPFARRARA